MRKNFTEHFEDLTKARPSVQWSKQQIAAGLEQLLYEGMRCLAFAVAVLVLAIIVMACY